MSPAAIVERAVAAGMGGIAATDHQSARNAPAVAECAARAGLAFLPGLEVCTAEEVHVLTIFDTVGQALAMTDKVYAALPKRVNDPETFGDQPVVTASEEIVEMEWRILAMACRLTVAQVAEECRALGGMLVAAHVDRPAFSVFSQLGGIPADAAFDAVEISRTADESLWLPRTADYAATRSSDAHNLDDVAAVWSEADIASFSVASLKEAFAARAVRTSPRLANFA